MALSDDIRTLESENERLLKENEELRNQQQNPAVDTLLDLLEPEVIWAETTTDRIHRKDFFSKLIKAFRELRPKE